jgi:hypothetical protein
MSVDYREVFATAPAKSRPLTLHELATLKRLGFPDLAQHLTKTRCETCGGHPDGVLHKDTCAFRRDTPSPAPVTPAQPWQSRPMRRQNAA